MSDRGGTLWHPESLRRRLHGTAIAPVPLAGDEGARAGIDEESKPPLKPAAVLIGLVPRADGPNVLLTRRTAHLRHHAGQVSFPGGRMEPEDISAAATALREAQEEIGLDPTRVELLGGLRSYETVTGFRIHPVVGWVDANASFFIDPFEVAELFEVPLSLAADPASYRQDTYVRDGQERRYYVLPYKSHHIWGATAGMLWNLAHLLSR